jgi:tetratricopeptide (TPR) repeat protein
VGLFPTSLYADWEQAVAAYRQGNFETATNELAGVIAKHPDYAPAYRLMGQALTRLGRYDEAVGYYDTAVSLETPVDPTTWLGLAQAKLGAGRAEEALADLGKVDAAALPAELLDPWAALLSRAAAEASPGVAAARLEEAARQAPDNAFLQLALGRAYEAAGRVAEAVDAYEKALALDPKNPTTAEALVHAAFRVARGETDPDRRAAWYERAAAAAEPLVKSAESAEHWILLGEARMGAKDLAAAVAAFEKAAFRAPTDPLPDYYLGRAQLSLGDGRKAISSLEEGLRKHPGDELAKRMWVALGEALHLRHEYNRAADAYRKGGETRRAELMERYATFDEINRGIDKTRQDCRDQLQKLEALLEESHDLAGTPEYERLRRDVERLRRECD